MRILITGKNGYIGTNIKKLFTSGAGRSPSESFQDSDSELLAHAAGAGRSPSESLQDSDSELLAHAAGAGRSPSESLQDSDSELLAHATGAGRSPSESLQDSDSELLAHATGGKSFLVDTISIRDGLPEDLTGYDTVIHCAAAVHGNTGDSAEIFRINRDLTSDLAARAKAAGVSHFIFISTMAVYGLEGRVGKRVIINGDTVCRPVTDYGKSKLEAEEILQSLCDHSFRVAILRPPMIYGDGCPGNYRKLERFAKIFPLFPYVKNERSMLHVDRLCEIILEIVEKKSSGIFLPQDEEYKNTSLLVKKISEQNGKKLYLSPALGAMVKLIDLPITGKIFGSLVYEHTDRAY